MVTSNITEGKSGGEREALCGETLREGFTKTLVLYLWLLDIIVRTHSFRVFHKWIVSEKEEERETGRRENEEENGQQSKRRIK